MCLFVCVFVLLIIGLSSKAKIFVVLKRSTDTFKRTFRFSCGGILMELLGVLFRIRLAVAVCYVRVVETQTSGEGVTASS